MKRVAVVVTLRDGGIVAVTRSSGGWALPGGGVEHGEQPADAARRELEEETGLRAPSLVWLCRMRTRSVHVDGFWAPEAHGEIRGSHEGAAAIVPRRRVIEGPYGDFAARCLAALGALRRRR